MLKVYIWLDIAKINSEPFIEIVEDRKFPYLLHYIRGIRNSEPSMEIVKVCIFSPTFFKHWLCTYCNYLLLTSVTEFSNQTCSRSRRRVSVCLSRVCFVNYGEVVYLETLRHKKNVSFPRFSLQMLYTMKNEV